MVKELLMTRIITGRAWVPLLREVHPLHQCPAPRRRGIQYAAASRFNHYRLGVLDRPVKPGDDSECVASASHALVIASAAKQSRLLPR